MQTLMATTGCVFPALSSTMLRLQHHQAACAVKAGKAQGLTPRSAAGTLKTWASLTGPATLDAVKHLQLHRSKTQHLHNPRSSICTSAAADGANGTPSGPVMVWFKADLRVDDHEGLLLAAQQAGAHGCLPVYCLDSAQLHHLAFTPAGLEVLINVLSELRAALRAVGSDLVIVRGSWQDAIPQLAQQYGARLVVAQSEVEHMLNEPAQAAAAKLKQSSCQVQWWTAPVWPPSAFKHNYREWRASRPAPLPPKPAPAQLPPLPSSCTDTGLLPDVAELQALLAADPATNVHQEEAVKQEVDPVLQRAASGTAARRQQRLMQAGRDWLQRLSAYLAVSSLSEAKSTSEQGSQLETAVKGGIVENETPSAEGASFPAMFATALALGALSRRRVLEQAGSSSSNSLTRKAAAITAESGDFHWQLAERNDMRPPDAPSQCQQKHWRWNGFLTDYCECLPPSGKALPADAPAVLLVHGFGAFGDQWRGNLEELAEAGYRVYAPTMPGFGRSEKVSVPYSQVLWSDFLRDFVLQVVGSPVVVAGNSIGGFIATNMASDHPSLVKGLVLMNSAGPIQASEFSMDKWKRQAETMPRPPKWLARGISLGLLWYLERTVPSTLQWLYPTNPDKARGWLEQEILRAAADVGAVDVFGAVFYLPPPRPLNWLVNECFKGPTLVLQGVLDPLNDAKGRANDMAKLCPQLVEVVEVQAGHCPHDEVPDQINAALLEWMSRKVMADQATASKAAVATTSA